MRTYIATFFSHFGAIRFHKMLMQRGVSGKIKPVPRDLSSSCGTCVEFGMDWESIRKWAVDNNLTFRNLNDDLVKEAIRLVEDGYEI